MPTEVLLAAFYQKLSQSTAEAHHFTALSCITILIYLLILISWTMNPEKFD